MTAPTCSTTSTPLTSCEPNVLAGLLSEWHGHGRYYLAVVE